jgi:hypothetical protein
MYLATEVGYSPVIVQLIDHARVTALLRSQPHDLRKRARFGLRRVARQRSTAPPLQRTAVSCPLRPERAMIDTRGLTEDGDVWREGAP